MNQEDNRSNDMNRPINMGGKDEEGDAIERRLLDEQQEGRQNLLDAANEAFVEDQREPDHPSRREREHGVDDPSHSQGSDRRRS
jgi:hypothetical protein